MPFWGPHDDRPHLGGQIPPRTLRKGAWLGHAISEKNKNVYIFKIRIILPNTQRGWSQVTSLQVQNGGQPTILDFGKKP